jgi:hypothetical protein
MWGSSACARWRVSVGLTAAAAKHVNECLSVVKSERGLWLPGRWG